MKYFLDSSAIIEFMRGNEKVSDLLLNAEDIITSTICEYEVLLGEKYRSIKSTSSAYDKAAEFFKELRPLPLAHEDCLLASDIAARLMIKGKMVDDFDILLAAQAYSTNSTIVTKDARHFRILAQEADISVTFF